MKLLDYFNSIDINEINRYINDSQEEHLHLDFKTVNHPNYNPQNKEDDKKNYAKCISGFANSDGGIIIWGVKAALNDKNQDVAKSLKPIEKLTSFLNLLNKLEGTLITPIVSGILHQKIEESEDIGYIKTFIPKSENPPHMALSILNHYYKRSGDSFYQCEHFDIYDMFNRKKTPKLSIIIDDPIIERQTERNIKIKEIKMKLYVINEGQSIAKYPLLKISINNPYRFYEYGIDNNMNLGMNLSKDSSKTERTYTGGSEIVLYHQLATLVDIIYLKLPVEDNLPDLIVDYTITAENAETTKINQTYHLSEFEEDLT